MKNVEKLDLLNNFVQSINEEFDVEKDNIYSSDWQLGRVYCPLNTKKKLDGDKEFTDFIKKEFNIDINNYLISLLHEIGHLMTETKELSDQRAILYASYEYQYSNNKITIDQYYDNYFKIPAEILATTWGVNYYKNNKEKCDNLLFNLSC